MKYLALLLLSILIFSCTTRKKLPNDSQFKDRGPAQSSSNIVFTSNVNTAKELFLFGNDYTGDTLNELTKVIDVINDKLESKDKIKIRAFMALSTDFEHGLVPNMNEVINKLDIEGYTFRSKDLPDSLKHVIGYIDDEMKFAPSLWLQDYGQMYYENSTPAFLDLSYSSINSTSEIHRYITGDKGLNGVINDRFIGKRDDSTQDTTLEGGDIEVLPNGVLLVGSVIHPKLKEFLKDDLGQEVVEVPASMVATGHVDEIFSIIPAPKEKTNGCGYALTHIDPLYGLRLALDKGLSHKQGANRNKFINAISYFTNASGEKMIHRDNFMRIPNVFDFNKNLPLASGPWGISPDFFHWYIYKSLEIDKLVKVGIKNIKSALKDDCPKLVSIGLPVIFSDYTAGESTFSNISYDDSMSEQQVSDAFKNAPINLILSPVNMIVLNEHLVMPIVEDLSASNWGAEFTKTFLETYKWIIGARLGKYGVDEKNLHYVYSNVFVANGGSLHCGSLTFRSEDKRVY